MGYYSYLKELLTPMGYYDLNSGPGAAELHAQGKILDELFNNLITIEREASLVTAISYGIRLYENIVPSRPVSGTIGDRREALMALLRIDGCGFTHEALNRTLRGCGINAIAQEAEGSMTLNVHFPGTRGTPVNFESLKKRIEQILPCHLNINYLFTILRWVELEFFATWESLEGTIRDWAELEAYLVTAE